METHWLRREGYPRVAIFVLGWAADWRVIERATPTGCDVVALYDFRTLEPTVINSYTERYLFAWSFGVRVAELLFSGCAFTLAVALNGTPRPVDRLYGIAPRRLEATLHGLAAGGMETFERRAYGYAYNGLREYLSPRGVDANIHELNALRDISIVSYEPAIAWDKAIVGSGDVIFPPENQLRYWAERAELLPLPHYPFGDGGLIEREIGNR